MEQHQIQNRSASQTNILNTSVSVVSHDELGHWGSLNGLIHSPGGADEKSVIHDDFKAFINAGKHPCVGAAAAFNKDEYWLASYSSMASSDASQALARDLYQYLQEQKSNPRAFGTFVAVFEEDSSQWSESKFEEKLWDQLSALDKISSVFFKWDESVSANPDDSKFSFSFGGSAFYIVGLHPNSSRIARSFKYPTLVFNLHSQFEDLRQSGKYGRMRDTIRGRDEKLQGSINPMMRDFGTGSEARQYSGREVDNAWKCPFHALASAESSNGEKN